MHKIKNILKSSIKSSKEKIAFYFSGDVIDCFILKTLLQDFKNPVAVFYLDKSEFSDDNFDYEKEHQQNLKILKDYQKDYRDFSFEETSFPALLVKKTTSELESPEFHIQNLDSIYQLLDKFDIFLLGKDKSFFTDAFAIAHLYNIFQNHHLPIKIITPFSIVEQLQITSEALSNCLKYWDINFDRIYNDNKSIIDLAKNLNDNKKNKDEIDKLINQNSDFNSIYRYLIARSTINACIYFIENYGQNINKQLYIHLLSNVISFNPDREKHITYAVVQGKITDQELNQILINFTKNWISRESSTTKERLDQFDYFFRLYDHKITEETKDQLMHLGVLYVDFINKPFLERIVNFGGDVGELIIRWIDNWDKKSAEFRVHYLLEKYQNKIHPLQLNEALLKAFSKKNYDLCQKLIEYGADKKILKYHNTSYGYNLWIKKRVPDIKTGRNYWRSKDRIIIKEILKQLGNPQSKIPPVIHVTGSNGKGSTCAFLKEILTQNGYKAHVFTSPGVIRDNENYLLAGVEITDEQYYNYLTKAENAFNKIKNSKNFKEKINQANQDDNLSQKDIQEDNYLGWSFIIPAIILAFYENKADATIVEVITGGELDLTNIFDEKTTVATIINNIIFGDNHANLKEFGSIQGAANTKSRLAKKTIPIISALQEDIVMDVIKQTATQRDCPLLTLDKDFTITEDGEKHFIYKGLDKEFKLKKPKLAGSFQINNSALAITALLKGGFKLKQKETSDAIFNAYHIGRFCEISNKITPKYERVWFGTSKFKFGTNDLHNNNNKLYDSDLLLTVTGESDMFIGCRVNDYKKYNQIISVNNKPNLVLQNKFDRLENLQNKDYLSSAISKIANIDNQSKYLSILTTGVESFPTSYLIFLNQIKQPNFKENLEFAKKHNLLDQNKIALLENKKLCPYNLLIARRLNIYEKLYIIAAKKLGINCQENQNYVEFSYKNITHKLSNACWINLDSESSVKLSFSKSKCQEIANKHNIKTPAQLFINFNEQKDYLKKTKIFLEKYQQIVLKPEAGTCQSLDVLFIFDNNKDNKEEKLQEKLKYLASKYKAIVLEEYIDAIEYRLLMFKNKPILLMQKTPTILQGDGVSNINQLANQINKNISNQFLEDYGNLFDGCNAKIDIKKLEKYLSDKDINIKTILTKKENISLNFAPFILEWNVVNIDDVITKPVLENIIAYNSEIGLTLAAFDFFLKDKNIIFSEINHEPILYREIKNQASEKVLKNLFNIKSTL
jgi:dihydrofolate synthase/folylpolyglutamate synthase